MNSIGELYSSLIQCLPHTPDDTIHGYWYNELDDEIMCENWKQANAVADFFEECGVTDTMHVHQYDSSEQIVNENRLGWWSVYVDGQ